jgi:hypothetical protein
MGEYDFMLKEYYLKTSLRYLVIKASYVILSQPNHALLKAMDETLTRLLQ